MRLLITCLRYTIPIDDVDLHVRSPLRRLKWIRMRDRVDGVVWNALVYTPHRTVADGVRNRLWR